MDISDRKTRLKTFVISLVKPHCVMLYHMEVPHFFLMIETGEKINKSVMSGKGAQL